MKNICFCLLILTSSFITNAQKLEENKTDEFTKNVVKRTSWEKLMQTMSSVAYFRISRINESYYFDLKFMNSKIFSIPESAELMFKLNNDSIYSLKNLKYVITEKGAGAIGFFGSEAYGIQVSYSNKNDLKFERFREHKSVKIRIYTNDGYIEEEIKPKFAEKIINAINLVK